MEICRALDQLLETLPPPSDAGLGDDADRQARAALALFIQISIESELVLERVPEDPSGCPNCDRSMAGESSPYCSVDCREQAGFVRQLRRNLMDGSVVVEERQAALGQVMWHVLGGGYPRRNKMVPERVLKKLLAQACAQCGVPAVTFDHRGSACNRTSNLEPLCWNCSATREFGDAEFLARPAVIRLLGELAARVGSPAPVRCCDDPDSWDWRDYVRRRKSEFPSE